MCGRPAGSEIVVMGRAVRACFDYVRQFGRIIVDLCLTERLRLVGQLETA